MPNTLSLDFQELLLDYQRDGFVVLRGLFSAAETAAWQEESDRLLAQPWVSPRNIRTPYRMNSVIPERVDPIVDVSPLFNALVRDERLLGPVRALLGEEALLFKDKLILKAPGVDGYTMHQDWAWGWEPLCPADKILSVSIQIDGADVSNGCIELFPGYHHKLLTPSGMQTNFRAEELAQIDLGTGLKMETQPGDVLIFHSLTPHQSGKNTASYSRRSLYLTYNGVSAGDVSDQYYDSYKQRLGTPDTFFK